MRVTITEAAVNKAKRDAARDKKRLELSDHGKGAVPGLRLRITPAGSASWVLGCRDAEGAIRRFPLGAWPAVGLSQARDDARAEREKIKKGSDPIAERKQKRAQAKEAKDNIGTLAALLEHYGTQRGAALRSWPDCQRQIKNVFARHLDRPLAKMTAQALQQTADAHGAQQAAAAAVRYLRPVLGWASKRGWVAREVVLIDPPATVQARDRVLTDDELVAIWRATDDPKTAPVFGKLVKLLILTGQRRDEVAEMCWPELNADRSLWTIPVARAKNGKAHLVPLTAAARTILPAAEPDAAKQTDLVFAGQRATPYGGWSKSKAALDAASGVSDWRLHDLRRTLATGLQRLGVRFEVTEAVLGHVSGSRAGVAGIYQRHTWADEKAAALAAWADRVLGLVEGKPVAGNVVPLRDRAAA